MKLILFSCISALSFFGWSQTQTFIPDANFEQELIDLGLDTGTPNGYVPTGNIDTLTELVIYNSNIAIFNGIEDFTALESFEFHCSNVASIDFSQNLQLKTLDCQNTGAFPMALTSISLPTSIEYVDFSYNGMIAAIDLTGLTNLHTLKLGNNQIASIDLSQNPNLVYLDIGSNELTSIDLTHNPNLTHLNVSANELSELDLTQNPLLAAVGCSQNNLDSLSVSSNPVLTYLNCALNSLTTLDLTFNLDLECLTCYHNNLTELDLSFNDSLISVQCGYNQLTNIQLGNAENLERFDCVQNQLTTLDFSQCPSLWRLYCNSNQLSSLTLPPVSDLEILSCYSNQLTELDLSVMPTNWSWIECLNNQLTCLKLSPSDQVEALKLVNNPNLSCIEIPGGNPPTGPWGTNPTIVLDPQMSFNSSCANMCVTSVEELISSERQLLRIVDLMGREVEESSGNQVIIYVYDDGSIERVFRVE